MAQGGDWPEIAELGEQIFTLIKRAWVFRRIGLNMAPLRDMLDATPPYSNFS